MTARADDYLAIPPGYGLDLRWSSGRTAIESATGATLAFVEQIGYVLDGVFAAGRVPHFLHVLHVLHILRYGGPGQLWRLREAYTRLAKEAGVHRFVGTLVAELCRDVPAYVAAPSAEDVDHALRRRANATAFGPRPRAFQLPGVGREEFEQRIDAALCGMTGDTLVHWLTYGCAPAEKATAKLAEVVVEPPPRVASLIEVAADRPRLAGAIALVPALEAALALPPRKLERERLPQGGYSDVTTRGTPERLLPSQFALEPIDFVRRFAENELLYFRREEPHHGEPPERLVVVDQGVRTWGGVRLAIAGAVLALAKPKKRLGPLRVVFTGDDEPPTTVADAVAFVERLESSDLSADPARALTRALGDAATGPRDVLLLTHPRALMEPSVLAAITGRGNDDRVFALAVADDGRATLDEWRGGGSVRLRAFRVDLAGAVQPEALPPPGPVEPDWTGDVEPIGYPFRPGLIDGVDLMAFDGEGRRMLVASRRTGVLHLVKLDGTAPEVLPRPYRAGAVLMDVQAVLGMPGSFAVCGRMVPHGLLSAAERATSRIDPAATMEIPLPEAVVAEVDVDARTIRIHSLGRPGEGTPTWYGLPHLRCVRVRWEVGPGSVTQAHEIHLDTGERNSGRPGRELADRATRFRPPWPNVTIRPPGVSGSGGPWVRVGPPGGVLSVGGVTPPWPPSMPESDGQRLFADVKVTAAQIAETTLALCAKRLRGGSIHWLHGPTGRPLHHVAFDDYAPEFLLSPDGGAIALRLNARQIDVYRTLDGAAPAIRVNSSSASTNVVAMLDPGQLTVSAGDRHHVFQWSGPRLEHRYWSGRLTPTRNVGAALPSSAAYAGGRLKSADVEGDLIAVVDNWGQVLLFRGDVLVAAVCVRSKQAAIRLPDGTAWGATKLLGRPVTPRAAEHIAAALRPSQKG